MLEKQELEWEKVCLGLSSAPPLSFSEHILPEITLTCWLLSCQEGLQHQADTVVKEHTEQLLGVKKQVCSCFTLRFYGFQTPDSSNSHAYSLLKFQARIKSIEEEKV